MFAITFSLWVISSWPISSLAHYRALLAPVAGSLYLLLLMMGSLLPSLGTLLLPPVSIWGPQVYILIRLLPRFTPHWLVLFADVDDRLVNGGASDPGE